MFRVSKIDPSLLDEVASLHKNLLSGFLSGLGVSFLRELYRALVLLEPDVQIVVLLDGKVIGFVSGTVNSKTLFRRVLLANPLGILKELIGAVVKRPYLLKKLFRVFSYPGFTEQEMIKAELLSIAVDERFRGQRMGKILVDALSREFVKEGISSFKVSVWKDLPANGFYKKMGFRFLKAEKFIDGEMNFYEFLITRS